MIDEDQLRSSVFRVNDEADSSELLGTAFGVSTEFVITCAHVIEKRPPSSLRFFGKQGELRALEYHLHPTPERKDLALVRVNTAVENPLPICSAVPSIKVLSSRGYLPEDLGWGGRELHFSSRGMTNVRYESQSRSFSIDNSFDLAGDIAAPGLSGSPLQDRSSGAIFGVICGGNQSRSRSWAVLFQDHEWPLLQTIMEWNELNLPRFGSVLNFVGTLQVCELESSACIAILRRSRKFIDEWNVSRSRLEAAVNTFLSSQFPVMAIVGDANVGKTWFLTSLASQPTHRPVIFLLAATLSDANSKPFDEFTNQALSDACRSNLGDPLIGAPTLRDIAALCKTTGRAPLILLDGLNEVENQAALRRYWIPNAIGLCQELQLKMIITSRTEGWPAIVRSIPNNPPCLYREPMQRDQEGSVDPDDFRLGEFNRIEEINARRSYGLTLRAESGLGGHPFMFRVASELQLHEIDASAGWYQLLKSFLERQLDDVVSRIRGHTARSLRVRLERIASSWTSGISSGFTWIEASTELGGDEVVNALIDAGIFISFEKTLRFTYDQIGEMLAPILLPPKSVFAGVACYGTSEYIAIDGSVVSRACVDLMKLEGQGDDFGLLEAAEALFHAIDTINGKYTADHLTNSFHFTSRVFAHLLMGAMRLVNGLPRSRGELLYRLCCKLVSCRDFLAQRQYFDPDLASLCKCVEVAPLSMPQRVDIILELAPWDNAWPWRIKDWEEEGRFKQDFLEAIEEAPDDAAGGRPGTVLGRLLQQEPNLVRPILAARLGDETKISHGPSDDSRGEATIASLCGGLLLYGYAEDPDATWHELGAAPQSPSTHWLITTFSKRDPNKAKSVGRLWLEDPLKISKSITLLETILDNFAHAEKKEIITQLHEILVESTDINYCRQAAYIARMLDKKDVLSWDWLVEKLERSLGRYDSRYLLPVPDGRGDAAIRFAHCNIAAGLALAEDSNGPLDEQASWAKYIRSIRQKCDAYEIGRLVEIKANKLKSDDCYTPWRELILDIARCGRGSERRCLIYSAFYDDNKSEITKEIRHLLSSTLQDESETQLIVEKITHWVTDWWKVWIVLRTTNALWADRTLLKQLRIRYSDNDSAASARNKLVDYWSGCAPDEQTKVSQSVVDAVRNGKTLHEVFSLSDFILPLLRRLESDDFLE
jgi:hypothetical protein